MRAAASGRHAMRWLVATGLLLAGGTVACSDSAAERQGGAGAAAGNTSAESAPNAERGRAILTAFRDSLPEYSGNGLRCTSCHLDDGRHPTALPWLGTAARYPQYRARPGLDEPLTQRVNECIARSLAGRMLPEDGREMRDILAYLESMRSAARPPPVEPVRLSGDPGHARQTMLASFVRANMPYDSAGVLSAQDAADVAAYVLSQPRPDHPGKERDWPKGDPPDDVAYATDAARAAGKPMPPARPLLPRRVQPIPAPGAAPPRSPGS
jgi:thiosulfate dehydrogenase